MGKWVIAMALTAILSGMWTAKDTSKEDKAALVAKWEQYQTDFDAIKEMGDCYGTYGNLKRNVGSEGYF